MMQKIRIKPFNLVGITIRTTNENNQAAKEIAELWQRFIGENILYRIDGKVDDTIYSVYTDYEGDYTKPYTAMLGCKVNDLSEIPEGLEVRSFEGGDYMKTSAKGDLTKGLIVDHWSKIWKMDLNRAYTADFEVFGEKSQDPSNAEVEFYVGIKE